MKTNQLIIYSMIALACGIYNCSDNNTDTKKDNKKESAPIEKKVNIDNNTGENWTGIVKSEKFQSRMLTNDIYKFTLITGNKLKIFSYYYGDTGASTLDALINPGDTVKLWLENEKIHPKYRSWDNDGTIKITKGNIKEVNGYKIKL